MNRLSRFVVHLGALVLMLIAMPVWCATLTVTSNADSGAGTLRDAIASATDGDTIVFNADMTISLASELKLNKSLIIDASGHAVVLDGNDVVRVLYVSPWTVTVQLVGLTIRNGYAVNIVDAAGGGIYNFSTLTLISTTVSSSSAMIGGGIYNDGGTLSLINSTVAGNSVAGSTPYGGGGILSVGGALSLTNSTVSDNHAGTSGGGIDSSANALTLSNSTISGNDALEYGGGIFLGNSSDQAQVTVSSSTISANVGGTVGGIYAVNPVHMNNSIVAGNASVAPPENDIYPGVAVGSSGNLIGGNPLLAVLADNGGSALTMLPQAASPAVDAIACTNVPALDQRGVARPQGSQCDIGATEIYSSHMVYAVAQDSHGTITPASQSLVSGAVASVIVAPNLGFEVSSVTGDTCTLTQQGTSTTWTTNAITRDCTVTARFADTPSQCTGTYNHSRAFVDDFPGYGSLDPAKWNVYGNVGMITVANHSVRLWGTLSQALPYVSAVGSPIPASGDFSVRWIATYGEQQSYGSGTLVLATSAPAYGATTYTNTANAWQDSTGYRVEVRTDATTVVKPYTEQPPLDLRHDIEYCWLADTIEVYVDGVQKYQQPRNAALTRPTTLWFGNPAGIPGPWQSLTLYYVQVRALNDVIFQDGLDGI